jgi:undecaprenyl diphosphate synthase
MPDDIELQRQELKRSEGLPAHVAVIMDGNGRWAAARSLPRLEGHREGRESVRAIVRTCAKIGISYLTLYTFSLENWQRPSDEVEGLMFFLEEVLETEFLELDENGVQLRAIGRIDLLPESTRKALFNTMEKLSKNDGLVLTLVVSYGGRAEIIDATKGVTEAVLAGRMSVDDISEESFRRFLYDPKLPDPDLLIRTSGELRVSNFLLWQIAYSEIYVTDTLWPDFREQALFDSIRAYQTRERRFGL